MTPGISTPEQSSLSWTPERERIDQAFIRAGHRPEKRHCDHKHWRSVRQDGRYCSCGTAMVDFGD